MLEIDRELTTVNIQDFQRIIDNERKEIVEVIPWIRNTSISLKPDKFGFVSIELIKKDSTKKRLNSYLPFSGTFYSGSAFYYYIPSKVVVFQKDTENFRGFLLSLFHEIGHSKFPETKKTIHLLKGKILRFARILEKIYIFLKYLLIVDVLPMWFLDKISKISITEERNAWAYSLRELRKLKKQGYDVFAGFENVDQIKEYIDYYLFSYDIAWMHKKLSAGYSLNDVQKSNIFFTKGFFKIVSMSDSDPFIDLLRK